MLFNATIDDVQNLKRHLRALLPEVKSGHLDEGIAKGCGFAKHASLLAGLKDTTALVHLDGAAFRERLAELGHDVPENGLLQAALYAVPGALTGETHEEGAIQAIAWEVERLRKRLDDDEEVDTFSLNLRHIGDCAFDCDADFSADHRITIYLTDDAAGATAIRDADPDALRGIWSVMLGESFVDDCIPEDLDLSGPPAITSGVHLDGVHVSVWPEAVVYTALSPNGDVSRHVHKIDRDTFETVREAMRAYPRGDANRVIAARRIVGLDQDDPYRDEALEAARPQPSRAR